jgi:uncharacterized OB-fold protein
VPSNPTADRELIVLRGRGKGLAPLIHPDNAPFWASIANRKLSLQRCQSCRTLRFPLAPRCHACLSAAFDWDVIDPRGTVSVAVKNPSAPEGMPRIGLEPPWQDLTPYLTGAVDMDGGLRLPGRIICDCGEARSPGTRVRGVTLETTSGTDVYGFAHTCVLDADPDASV